MKPGDLRHRITIEQSTETQDSFGAAVETWAPFSVRWASITPATGREFFASEQLNADVSHVIRLRYVAGITPKMRARLGTRLFNIEVVRNLGERGEEVELFATETL